MTVRRQAEPQSCRGAAGQRIKYLVDVASFVGFWGVASCRVVRGFELVEKDQERAIFRGVLGSQMFV